MPPLLHSLLSSLTMMLISAGAVGCAPQTAIVQREAADPEAVAEAMALRSSGGSNASSRAYLHYARGMLAMHHGDFSSAETELRAALLHDRNSAAIRVALAEAEWHCGLRQRAIQNLSLALDAEPGNPRALSLIGLLVDDGGSLDEAELLLRGALTRNPGDGHLIGTLGSLLLQRGEVARALAKLELASELLPEDPEILERLGDALVAAGRVEAARLAYTRALKIQKERWGAGAERERALEQKIAELDGCSSPPSLLE